MDAQYMRGQLAAVTAMLEHLGRMVEVDADRLAVSARDDHGGDPDWDDVARMLADANRYISWAQDRVVAAKHELYRLAVEGRDI